MKTFTYIKATDLPSDVAKETKAAIRIKTQISKLEKQLERKKELLLPHTNSIKEYLLRRNLQGISSGERKIYLQDNVKVPSFKNVLLVCTSFIPVEYITRMEMQYEKMVEVTGKRVVINGKES